MDEPHISETSRRIGGNGACLLKGCLVVTIAAMLVGVVIGAVGWYFYRYAQPFYSQGPVPIRQFEGGDAAYAAVQAKLAEFDRTMAGGQKAVVTLTADDLNALVAHDPRLADLRDRLFLSLINNQLVAEMSYPLSNDPQTEPGQRMFFNGRAVLDASYSSGDITFLLSRLETLAGKEPPASILKAARRYVASNNLRFNRNFRDHPEQSEDLRQALDQLRTVIIQDNQVIVTSVDHPKPAATPEPSPIAGTPKPE